MDDKRHFSKAPGDLGGVVHLLGIPSLSLVVSLLSSLTLEWAHTDLNRWPAKVLSTSPLLYTGSACLEILSGRRGGSGFLFISLSWGFIGRFNDAHTVVCCLTGYCMLAWLWMARRFLQSGPACQMESHTT